MKAKWLLTLSLAAVLAAKSGDKGASVVGTALEITPGVRPYQLTESGLAL